MHSKRLGTLGEMRVASELLKLGFSVFLELGDISRKDLIVEIGNRLLSIQVKSVTKVDGKYQVKFSKSGPGYAYKYAEGDCDVFAVYCVDDDVVAWIDIREFLTNNLTQFNLRADPVKNNQTSGIRKLEDYLDITRVLRGHEQNNLPGTTEVDDMVQTTTAKPPADENQSGK